MMSAISSIVAWIFKKIACVFGLIIILTIFMNVVIGLVGAY